MFPNHPNLLPAYFEGDPKVTELGNSYARKPLFSREGANVDLIVDGKPVDRDAGPYGAEGFIRQAVAPLPEFDGNYTVLGSWFAAGEPCGLNVREEQAPSPRIHRAFCRTRSLDRWIAPIRLAARQMAVSKRRDGSDARDHLLHDVFVRAVRARGRSDDSADRPRFLAAARDRRDAGGGVHLLRHGAAGAGAGRGLGRQEARDDRLPCRAGRRVVPLRRRDDVPAIVHRFASLPALAAAGCFRSAWRCCRISCRWRSGRSRSDGCWPAPSPATCWDRPPPAWSPISSIGAACSSCSA